MPHIFSVYSTCDCQDFQACWYRSAVQPVETGRRGCPDLMDYCMRPRGTGTSVLTWLFNPRVGRDLAVSSPPSTPSTLTAPASPTTTTPLPRPKHVAVYTSSVAPRWCTGGHSAWPWALTQLGITGSFSLNLSLETRQNKRVKIKLTHAWSSLDFNLSASLNPFSLLVVTVDLLPLKQCGNVNVIWTAKLNASVFCTEKCIFISAKNIKYLNVAITCFLWQEWAVIL